MGIVEDLEWAIDIVDLVGRYTKLKKAGANYKSLCPFPGHNEKTPSFVVSPSKQIGYCFGCHRWGWPVKFIMDVENCEFKEALEILGNYTGIQVNTKFDPEKMKQKKSLYWLYKDAANYYSQRLHEYPEVKKYLYDRGMNEDIFRDFSIWYSDSWVELYHYLQKKWYEEADIKKSQIFLDTRTKKDKFIGRIIFPIRNARGDFVAFAGRILKNGEPKYLNSPASQIYDKSNILYNLFWARTAITKQDFIIITEGYMDVISLHKWWFINVVSVSGTALTEKHLQLIKRLTKKVYLCFDGDSAGQKAVKASLEKMKNEGFEVKIISLPKGKDPDDIISSGKDFWEYISSALSPIGYLINISKFDSSSIDDKKKLLEELLVTIKSYSDTIEKDYYLKEVAKLLDINQKIVYDRFNKIRFTHTIKKEAYKKETEFGYIELAIAHILRDETYKEKIQESILFTEKIPKMLDEVLKNGKSAIEHFDLATKEQLKGLALQVETEILETNQEHQEKIISNLILWLNRALFNREKELLLSEIDAGKTESLKKYSELMAKAKKSGIK